MTSLHSHATIVFCINLTYILNYSFNLETSLLCSYKTQESIISVSVLFFFFPVEMFYNGVRQQQTSKHHSDAHRGINMKFGSGEKVSFLSG